MTHASTPSRAALLPTRTVRAGVLAFFAALAFVEVGAGAVVAVAWRQKGDRSVLPAASRDDLSPMLERLRTLEGVVAAGAVAATLVWALLSLYNAGKVHRNHGRATVVAVGGWLAAPLALVVLGSVDHTGRGAVAETLVLAGKALAVYTPFALTGRVAAGLGAPRLPFLRWYLAAVAAFAVHQLFTAQLDLASPQPSDNFGRTATMYLVNAAVVTVLAVMAADATRSLQVTIAERYWQVRQLHDDAHQRRRTNTALSEPIGVAAFGPAPAATLPAPVVAQAPAALTPPAGFAPPSVPAAAPVLTPRP